MREKTAKEKVLELAPEWTEEQAERALLAAGKPRREKSIEEHKALLKRAADFRARQTETVDAVALVHEGRDELAKRGR